MPDALKQLLYVGIAVMISVIGRTASLAQMPRPAVFVACLARAGHHAVTHPERNLVLEHWISRQDRDTVIGIKYLLLVHGSGSPSIDAAENVVTNQTTVVVLS